jgi:hypothetical protein
MPDQLPFNPGIMYDPDSYLKAQRAQLIANALTQYSLTPSNPQNPGAQASRVSPLSMLARVLAGKMSGNALDTSLKAQGQMYSHLAQAQQQSLGGPSASGGSPGFFASPEYGGGQAPIPAQPDQASVYQHALGQYYTGVPEDVRKQYLANNAPTEAVRTGQQLGVAPSDVANKQFGIETRPGGSLLLPGGKVLRNPNLSPNLEPIYNGTELTGARAIPGAAEGLGSIEQAESRGKLLGGMVEVPQAGGGPPMPSLASRFFGIDTNVPAAPGQSSQARSPPPSPTIAAPAKPQDTYWGNMPIYREPTGIGSQGTRAKATSEAIVADENQKREHYGQLSSSAAMMSQNNAYLLPHLKNATVGAGSDTINHLRSIFAHTGMLPKDSIDKLSDTEITNKYLSRNGTEGLMARFGSRLAVKEVDLAVNKQAPNISQQQRSIITLTTADEIKNAYDRQRAQDFRVYISKGGDPREYETWYQEHHSLNDFVKQNGANISKRVVDLYNGGSGAITKTIGGKTYVNPTGKPGDWELQ